MRKDKQTLQATGHIAARTGVFWKNNLAILALVLVLPLFLSAGCEGKPVTKTGFALDTFITITLYQGGSEKLLEECFWLISEYEKILSRTLPESEISRLNREGNAEVSEETAALIKKGLDFGDHTGGAFDITIGSVNKFWDFYGEDLAPPPEDIISEALTLVDYRAVTVLGNAVSLDNPGAEIDLGGIAKGYICDQIREFLEENRVKSAICDFGGNVAVFGGKPGGAPFRVGIRNPFDVSGIFGVLEVTDASVVTSGTYERFFDMGERRYHHILDPKTGFPSENGVVSVTVIGTSAADADALSTACLVKGDLSALVNVPYEGILIRADGSMEKTEGIGTDISFKLETQDI